MGIVQGKIVRDGNCPVGSRPDWELSRGEFSGVGTVRGGNYLGGNCPGWELSGWELSGGYSSRGELSGWIIVRGVLVQGGVVRSPMVMIVISAHYKI